MPCRVGITTQPDVRRQAWENSVVGLSDWRILERGLTRQQAQAREDYYARTYKCIAHHGGGDAHGTWCVYKFSYIREKG